MIGHELAIEQGEAAETHPGGQPGQRHLRRIGAPGHHAFPEKGPAQRHAVEAADQLLPLPYFDGVGETYFMQVARSEENTSELQSLMRISYAVICLKKKTTHNN